MTGVGGLLRLMLRRERLGLPWWLLGAMLLVLVLWAFYGNPLEAPVIRYSNDESRFHVGTVVVLAEYTASQDLHGVVTPMKYRAKVNWADGQT